MPFYVLYAPAVERIFDFEVNDRGFTLGFGDIDIEYSLDTDTVYVSIWMFSRYLRTYDLDALVLSASPDSCFFDTIEDLLDNSIVLYEED